jgi:peroxiredoxin Q/BCP
MNPLRLAILLFSTRHWVRWLGLPFQLLSDQGGKVRKLFGVPTTLGFIPGRVTYIIDKSGTVRHTFTSQTNIDKHIADALRVVKEIATEPLP